MSLLLKNRIEQTLGRPIPEPEFEAFKALLYSKTLDKKSVLAEEGEVCKYIYFIVSRCLTGFSASCSRMPMSRCNTVWPAPTAKTLNSTTANFLHCIPILYNIFHNI